MQRLDELFSFAKLLVDDGLTARVQALRRDIRVQQRDQFRVGLVQLLQQRPGLVLNCGTRLGGHGVPTCSGVQPENLAAVFIEAKQIAVTAANEQLVAGDNGLGRIAPGNLSIQAMFLVSYPPE